MCSKNSVEIIWNIAVKLFLKQVFYFKQKVLVLTLQQNQSLEKWNNPYTCTYNARPGKIYIHAKIMTIGWVWP